jgi:hypothetical protein
VSAPQRPADAAVTHDASPGTRRVIGPSGAFGALEVWLAGFVVLKTLDVALIGPQLLPPALAAGLTLGLLAGAAAVLFAGRSSRPQRTARCGWALIGVAFAVMLTGPLYRNHVFFLLWVSAILVLVGDRASRRLLLTSHLAVVYAFAGVVKLNPLWLSGASLEQWGARLFGVPVVLAAVATIVVELVLAFAVWRPNRTSLALAAVMHVAFVVGVAGGPFDLVRLVVFNGASIALWWALWRERQRADTPLLAPLRRPRP